MNHTYILARSFAPQIQHVPPMSEQLKWCHRYFPKYQEKYEMPDLAGTVPMFETTPNMPFYLHHEGQKLMRVLQPGDHLLVTLLEVFGGTVSLRIDACKKLIERRLCVHVSEYATYPGMIDDRMLTGMAMLEVARKRPKCKKYKLPERKIPWGFRVRQMRKGPMNYDYVTVTHRGERRLANRLRHRLLRRNDLGDILVWIQEHSANHTPTARWKGADWTFERLKRVAFEIFEKEDAEVLDFYYPEGPDEEPVDQEEEEVRKRLAAITEPDDAHD